MESEPETTSDSEISGGLPPLSQADRDKLAPVFEEVFIFDSLLLITFLAVLFCINLTSTVFERISR